MTNYAIIFKNIKFFWVVKNMYKNELEKMLNKTNYTYDFMFYLTDENFENELIEFVISSVKLCIINSFPKEEDIKKVLFGLTFLALKYYDGSLWPYIFEKFAKYNIDQKLLENKIRYNVLDNLVAKYRLGRSQIQVPVMNSLVPVNYSSDYFVFVDDIYTKNLDCNLNDFDVDEELENVFIAIQSSMNDDSDSFQYNYEQKTSKTYKLIKATKNIIRTGIKREELIHLTKDYIKKIDSYYSGKSIYINDYIDKAFKTWNSTRTVVVNPKRVGSNFFRSKSPYFTFFSNNLCVYVHTPTKRIFGDYDPNSFSVSIYDDAECIYTSNILKIKYLLGGFDIEQIDIKLDNPLAKIRCIIRSDETILYDSKNSLYRTFLMFDEKGNEVYNFRNYSGVVYFVYKNRVSIESKSLYIGENYKVSYSYVKLNDEFMIDDNYISLSSNRKTSIVGEIVKGIKLEDCDIYQSIEEICLVSKSKNINNLRLLINGIYKEIVKENILDQRDSIAILLETKSFIDSGIYDIKLVDIKKNSTEERVKFMYDPFIKVEQYLEDPFCIRLNYSGTYNLVNLVGKEFKSLSLRLNDINEKTYYLLMDNMDLIKCLFCIMVPYYRIDNGNIYCFEQNIFYTSINANSRLYFGLSNCESVKYNTNDIEHELSIRTLDNQRYINIGELLNFKDELKKLEVLFLNGNSILKSITLYFDAVFDEEKSFYSIDSRNQEIFFKTIVNGVSNNEKIYLRLENRDGIVYDESINFLTNESIIQLNSRIRKIHYKIYKKITRLIGFKTILTEDILKEDDIAYYPIQGLLGKYLPIVGCYLGNNDESEIFAQINFNEVRLVRMLDSFSYIGYFYNRKYENIVGYSKVDELRIQLSQVYKEGKRYYIDATICLYYSDDEDGIIDLLQYDPIKKKVLDGYNKKYKYIKSYKIDLTLGEKNYGKFKSNQKSKIYSR